MNRYEMWKQSRGKSKVPGIALDFSLERAIEAVQRGRNLISVTPEHLVCLIDEIKEHRKVASGG